MDNCLPQFVIEATRGACLNEAVLLQHSPEEIQARSLKSAFIAFGVSGVLIHLLGFALLQVGYPPTPVVKANLPRADVLLPVGRLSPRAQKVLEQGLLRDPEPLILPTLWNAEIQVTPLSPYRSSSIETQTFEPLLLIDGTQLTEFPRKPPLLLDTPEKAIELRPAWLMEVFAPAPVPPFSSGDRRPLAFVYDSQTRAEVGTEPLEGVQWPLLNELTATGVFSVTLSADGTPYLPLLIESTGNRELDTSLREAVGRLKALRSLPSGTYRIVLGP